jgi:hypothetical protein
MTFTGVPLTKTRLIGFSGYARAGKDTAVQVLRTEGYQRVAFADLMRTFLETLNPVVGYDSKKDGYVRVANIIDSFGWDGYKESYWGTEMRQLMQRLGTECGRELFGENFWVDSALNNLEPEGFYAVADCRFVNEADAIRERGGKVIRIARPGVGPANSHPSETSLDDYDFDAVVNNDDSHEVLRQRLLRYL